MEGKQHQEEFGISINELDNSRDNRQYPNENDTRELLDYSFNNNENSKNEEVTRVPTKNSLIMPERRKSYQIRAMFRKTLSYQKRQFKTNL
eukprot:jgi/Orpsp1_1/1188766/evm.model.d7180000067027.1